MLPARPEVRRLTWLLIAAAIVLWLGRDVLGPFVLAAALAYAFTPLVDRVVAGTGWPRLAVVGLGYAAALIGLVALVWLVAGPLLAELDLLARNGPRALAVRSTWPPAWASRSSMRSSWSSSPSTCCSTAREPGPSLSTRSPSPSAPGSACWLAGSTKSWAAGCAARCCSS